MYISVHRIPTVKFDSEMCTFLKEVIVRKCLHVRKLFVP